MVVGGVGEANPYTDIKHDGFDSLCRSRRLTMGPQEPRAPRALPIITNLDLTSPFTVPVLARFLHDAGFL